jgi:ABC-2 type transport system permease protein
MFEMADHEEQDAPAINPEDAQLCAPWFQQAAAAGFGSGEMPNGGPDAEESPQIPISFERGPRDDQMEKLRDGDLQAVMIFPVGYGEQVDRRLAGASDAAQVQVYYDASQTTSAQIVTSIISALLDAYDRQLSGTQPVVQADLRSTTSEQFNFLDFFVPGVTAVSLMQLGIFGALTIVSLRERKILKRLGATPLPRRTLVLSQVILRLGIALVQAAIILTVGRVVYNVNVGNQLGLMVGFILLGGMTFVAFGYMVASFARTEAAGNAIVQAIQFPMMFLSGVYFPIDFSPDWLRPVINAMPLTYLGDALRQVMVEGSTKLFPLWVNAAVLTGWLVVSLLVSFRFFRWE